MKASRRNRLALLPRISVLQRFTLTLILMLLLVGAASSLGFWFAIRTQNNIRAVSRDANLSSGLLELQTSWLSMVDTMNAFSIVLPPAEIRRQLQNQLDEYNQELIGLFAQPLGRTPEKIAENQQIAQELAQIGIAMDAMADQVYRLIEEGDWIDALQTRQSTMAELQPRMSEALNHLNMSIQNDISAQNTEIQRLQSLARNYGIAIFIIAIGLSLLFGWVNRKFTFNPLHQLTANIQHIAQTRSAAELSPVTPLTQQDEIGDLSRAFAQVTEWMRESFETLEQRIAERTQGLERRTLQLQVAAEVARDIASTPNPEELLVKAVDLIRDRFGFYHAGVFLNDTRYEYAVLRAATGEAGREMLARGHKLKIGETGLVGYVAWSGEPRIALDVGLDAVHFKNPLLPNTRSEVALPMKLGYRVIGVLDVQSQEPAAFDEESITVLQIIADQLVVAIQNARLLQEMQENLKELERAYGRYETIAWERLLQSASTLGYQYDGMSVTPIRESASPAEATEKGKPISMPLHVRGETIGTLDVWPQEDQLSIAETYMLAIISDRISQILESARLFEETQTRAAREEAINRLTTSLNRSLDTDSVLQTAVREIAGLPSVVEATIFLGTCSDIAPNGVKGDGDGKTTAEHTNTVELAHNAEDRFLPTPGDHTSIPGGKNDEEPDG